MRISSVAFETEDLLRAESFYGSVLGLPTTRLDGMLTIRAGSSLLTLHEGPLGPSAQHLAFTIPRLMFESAKDWITDRVPLLSDADGRDEFETSPHWNAHSLYFLDPDGNILEFIIRRDIPDNRTEAFRPGHVQCISEVGIAVEDVPEVAARAESTFGIEAYGNGAPSFQPVGDVEGLLIFVTPGRHWFPTSEPSRTRRLTVHINSKTAGSLEPSPGITIHSKVAANEAPHR
jgi:catechol-2,3-dioxygenase